MQEYTLHIKRNLLQMVLLAAAEVGIASCYGQQTAVISLIMGNSASFIYFLQLCYRIKRTSTLPAAKAVTNMRVGWILSLGFIVLFLVLSTKIVQVNLLLVIIGLFSFQIIVFLDSTVIVVKSTFIFRRKG
ncbi:MAG: synthase chain [Firmicutes bacterium]|nr:synthase chain [Bacillota bacterium]